MTWVSRAIVRCTLALSSISALGSFAAAENLAWVRQPGGSVGLSARAVSADGMGHVYFSGLTGGSLGGPAAGGWDAVVGKYDGNGDLLWIRQIGSENDDLSAGVSADGLGNVYACGTTWGISNGPHDGLQDSFLAKYDAAGALLWQRGFGAGWPVSSSSGRAVSADGLGNVFITGESPGFVSRYDAAGNLQWTREISEAEECRGAAADGQGNVYITGRLFQDAFIHKYDNDGNLIWSRSFRGPRGDFTDGNGVTVDEMGDVYAAGSSNGLEVEGDHYDAFLVKYDAAGHFQWVQTPLTFALGMGVSADGSGTVYVSGSTGDAFVARYDAAGHRKWLRQMGVSGSDSADGVSADGLGNVYIIGDAAGNLGAPGAVGPGAFLAKFSVPEPTSLVLAALVIASVHGLLTRNSARSRRLVPRPGAMRSGP